MRSSVVRGSIVLKKRSGSRFQFEVQNTLKVSKWNFYKPAYHWILNIARCYISEAHGCHHGPKAFTDAPYVDSDIEIGISVSKNILYDTILHDLYASMALYYMIRGYQPIPKSAQSDKRRGFTSSPTSKSESAPQRPACHPHFSEKHQRIRSIAERSAASMARWQQRRRRLIFAIFESHKAHL